MSQVQVYTLKWTDLDLAKTVKKLRNCAFS